MKNIRIIGAGEIGRAIAKILENKKELNIRLWDKDPSKIPNQTDLPEFLAEAEILFLCIPSWCLKEALGNILPHLPSKTLVVSLSKGLEENTGKTMAEFLQDNLPANPFILLAGPMLAEELSRGLAGATVAAGKEETATKMVMDLFVNTLLKIETSKDPRSVAWASVLKNIYAIALGIADGLNWSGNQKGWLSAKATGEMLAISEKLDVKKEIILGTAGLGDFIATGYSPYSHNRQLGDELVKTGDCRLKTEGLVSLPSFLMRIGNDTTAIPILAALAKIILENKNPREEFRRFFSSSSFSK